MSQEYHEREWKKRAKELLEAGNQDYVIAVYIAYMYGADRASVLNYLYKLEDK